MKSNAEVVGVEVNEIEVSVESERVEGRRVEKVENDSKGSEVWMRG